MTSKWNSEDEKALWEASDNDNLPKANFCPLLMQVRYSVECSMKSRDHDACRYRP